MPFTTLARLIHRPSANRHRGLRHDRRLRFAALVLVATLVPTTSSTQPGATCPRFARVPGYGACVNFSGNSCGFCAYRCNDETVVRWNVCAP